MKWSDLDWETRMLSIQRQVIRKTAIGLVLEDLKTTTSRRTIPLGTDTLCALREHRKRQNEEKLASEWWETREQFQGMIFATEHGKPLDPATTWATFQRTLVKAGLPRTTLHALRDTAATNMLRTGIDAKTIAKRLGHSDVALTLRVYAGLTPEMHQEAADRLEALYRSATTGR